MHIVGTAGHVDHGKSSLVRALTGTDPDRWVEEQRRGMTLDLGFAHLGFDDGVEAGIIDVPGHERFLHNMLAGAAGMEVVLLVVAANEGVKPQTLEHLAILGYLNVQRTLVVLTKADTIDVDERPRVEARVRAALDGTIAADAPFFAVSTRTGAGLPALRAGIHDTLVTLCERAPHAPAYLPVDRVFALSGHGTIVTGTLMQGRIGVGDTLKLSPLGREVRVRNLHVFGEKRETVNGGMRVAINLPGIETSEIARGAVVASIHIPSATTMSVIFRSLPGAHDLLKRRTPVRAYIGAAEILGTLVFESIPTGPADVRAQLILRTPTVAVPGAPFVVRRVSPMTVIGGGTIAIATAADNTTLDTNADTVDDREHLAVLAALRGTALVGATPAQLSATANLGEEHVRRLIAELVADGRVIAVAKPPGYVASDLADDLRMRAIERLEDRQRERPWLMGSTSIALAQTLDVAEPALIRVLAAYVEAEALAYRNGYYATLDFTPRLSAAQRAFFDAELSAEAAQPPVPVAMEHLRTQMRASKVPELAAAFETLLANGTLSKVDTFIYRGTHIRAVRARLEALLRANGRITVAQFRDATGTSRKYAVPLLEFFDATGVTLRSGDFRVLRRAVATHHDSWAPPNQ